MDEQNSPQPNIDQTETPAVSGDKPAKKPKPTPKLTHLQRRFCAEYVIDMNATQAAIRAGYSEKTAYSSGQRLLKSVEIQAGLAEWQRKMASDLEITPKRVLKEWAGIAFGNIDDFTDDEGRIDLSKATRAQKATISEITTETYVEGHGEDAETVKRVKLKFHSKTQSLDALSKHLGLFETDNKQKGVDVDALRELIRGIQDGGSSRLLPSSGS
jgi:phage terminase small subunit